MTPHAALPGTRIELVRGRRAAVNGTGRSAKEMFSDESPAGKIRGPFLLYKDGS
jgi:hypothetical protein